MVKVQWTAENDRKLLLQLITPSTKDIPVDHIATLFPGATSKSIIERIAKLRREKKAFETELENGGPSTPPPPRKYVKKGEDAGPTPSKAQRSKGIKSEQNDLYTSDETPVAANKRGKKRGRSEADERASKKKVKVEDEVNKAEDGEEEIGSGSE